MTHLIDGVKWASESRAQTAQKVQYLIAKGIHPTLVVVLVGENPASLVYVRGKEKAAAAAGIRSRIDRFPATITEQELLTHIELLNGDPAIHGILVQLPMPDHINEQMVIATISPEKDVDGFHAQNVGALTLGLPGFIPCTPLGVMKMLAYENIEVAGKHAVIIGRSNIVGRPMSQLLLQANATVTICHSHTKSINEIVRQADILVVAIGRPKFVTSEMVRPGAVVIDVGMNRVEGKLYGDVDFDAVAPLASAITPVPKGVGPMTIAMLLHNTIQAAKSRLILAVNP
jgi:methylenetetrahydrofolate dehydrogenase (NADP+)/methenyltetrahydrofolate cyclohydrolase